MLFVSIPIYCWYSLLFTINCLGRPESWPSCNAKLKSQANQIEHSAANVSPPLRHFLKRAVLPERNNAEISQQLVTRIGVNYFISPLIVHCKRPEYSVR